MGSGQGDLGAEYTADTTPSVEPIVFVKVFVKFATVREHQGAPVRR